MELITQYSLQKRFQLSYILYLLTYEKHLSPIITGF